MRKSVKRKKVVETMFGFIPDGSNVKKDLKPGFILMQCTNKKCEHLTLIDSKKTKKKLSDLTYDFWVSEDYDGRCSECFESEKMISCNPPKRA